MKICNPFQVIKQFVFGVFLAVLALNVQAESNLWSLVWASHEQAKSLSYSGLLITESGNYSQSSKLLHQATSEGEFEVLERLDGQSAKWIRYNDQIQCVIPDRKLILIERRHTSVAFPRVFVDADSSENIFERLYSISELPGRRVAGREVRVLKLSPKDDMRYGYQLYLDRENKLMMRSELYSPEGEVLEQVGFKEINFSPVLMEKPSLLKAAPGWRTNSTEVRALDVDELPYDLPELAFGFKKADTVCRTKGKDEQIHQTVYSDGLSTVSIFIQKHQGSHSMPQVPMSHGAVMSRSETQGMYMVTVLGEVPEKTLGLFLKSVRWKSQ